MKKATRIIKVILIMSFLPMAGWAQQVLSLDKSESKLSITGTSTLHDWEIIVNDFNGKVEGNFNITKPGISSAQLNCKVKSFESGKSRMDNVVYDALKQEKHPEIKFKYKNIKQMTTNGNNLEMVVVGDLTIAGQTREMEIPLEAQASTSRFVAKGQKSFKMSEFEVDPPSVMFGTIKAGDKSTVNYSIIYN